MDHFIKGLATIEDKFSDCTLLLSGGKTLRAHRIVLHLHSPVLATKISEISEQAQNGENGSVVLSLGDDNLDAARAMLHFFYNGTYAAPHLASALTFHVAVLQIAEKYETSALSDLAYAAFQGILLASSWNTQDLVSAAARLEDILDGTPRAEQMREDIIQTISQGAYDLFDSFAFKPFIQANPEWVIRLLKIYDPHSQLHQEGNGLASSEGHDGHDQDGEDGGMSGEGGDDEKGGNSGCDGSRTPHDDWGTNSGVVWGTGRVLGHSKSNDTSCIYGRRGPKPASKEFMEWAKATRQLGR